MDNLLSFVPPSGELPLPMIARRKIKFEFEDPARRFRTPSALNERPGSLTSFVFIVPRSFSYYFRNGFPLLALIPRFHIQSERPAE